MSKVGFNWNANRQSAPASQHSNDYATLYKLASVFGHTASPRRLEGVHVRILENHALQAV